MERFDTPRNPMENVQFTIVNSDKRACKRRARRLTERDWAQHKTEIVELYSVQGLSLPRVQAIFKGRHNFTATDRQWKHRFKQWELDKNIKLHEMKAMVRIKQTHKLKQPEHSNIAFKIRGISVDPRKIERWMNEHNVADDEPYEPDANASTPPELEHHTWQEHSSLLPSDATVRDEPASSSISMPAVVRNPEVVITELGDPPMLSKPRCKVVDLSWALNATIQELRVGHANDQHGYPLGTLAQNIKCYDEGLAIDISRYTLAQALQQTRIVLGMCSFLAPGIAQEHEWFFYLDRKQIEEDGVIINATLRQVGRAVTERHSVRRRLELRARMASPEHFSFDGSAIFSVCSCNYPCVLEDAIQNQNIGKVERILRSGEATVCCSPDFRRPIELSAKAGNVEITRLLLSWGLPICNLCSNFDNLIAITWRDFKERWGSIGPHDKDVSFQDDLGRCKELTSLALEYGARVDECVSSSGDTILHNLGDAKQLQTGQCLQVVQFLLGLGFDMEHRNKDGETPLLRAIRFSRGNHGVISAFLASGANLKAVDNKGRGYLAIFSERLSSPELILLLSADPTFSGRVINPGDIGNIPMPKLVDEGYWDLWSSVFEEMRWDMDKMNAFRFTRLLQPLPRYTWPVFEEKRLQCLAKMRSRIGEARALELEASYRLQSAQD